ANHRTAGVTNQLTDCVRDCVVPYVSVVELRHHGAPCIDIPEDNVGRSFDVVPYVCIGAFQGLATRRKLALKCDDLVAHVNLCDCHALPYCVSLREGRFNAYFGNALSGVPIGIVLSAACTQFWAEKRRSILPKIA